MTNEYERGGRAVASKWSGTIFNIAAFQAMARQGEVQDAPSNAHAAGAFGLNTAVKAQACTA